MHNQHTRPALPNAAVICLSVAVVTGTVLAGAVVASVVTPYRPSQGVGAALAAVTAIAGCGCIVSVATDRLMRRLDQLEEAVAAQRVTYLPPAPKEQGVRHLRVAGEQVGLSPEAIAAARALARRIADANGQ